MNYEVIMDRYQLDISMLPFIELPVLPKEKCPLVKILQTKEVQLSQQQVNAGMHLVDVADRVMGTVIAVRWHMWPSARMATTLPDDIKLEIEDLIFHGATLFVSLTDEILIAIWKNKQTAKLL